VFVDTITSCLLTLKTTISLAKVVCKVLNLDLIDVIVSLDKNPDMLIITLFFV